MLGLIWLATRRFVFGRRTPAALLLAPLIACAGFLCWDATAQNLIVYSNSLVNGFEDWSWGTRNLGNTNPVHSLGKSIGVTPNVWDGISFHHADINTSFYTDYTFWANGGTNGGQRLQVNAEAGGVSGPTYLLPSALPKTNWQQYTISLNTLGVANKANLNRITIQVRNDGTVAPYFLDDVVLVAKPLPSTANISLNATQALQTVEERHFGVNLAMWDTNFDNPTYATTIALLKEMGTTVVRMPGGSLSDEYHWMSNTTLSNTWTWSASFPEMVRVVTNAGVQAFVVVNYGSGTAEEAAGWVRFANNTNHLGFKYWEIGNECYGTWERDTNAFDHDPYTYAQRATNYLAQMRAADPSIKIGVVVAPGEGSFSNTFNFMHPAYNARTGKTNYGWTPILLATLGSMGVKPDFLIHHVYPEYTGQESDPTLLQYASNWATDAADLRQQITDYFGPSGSNIDLVVTENNANAGDQGRQSTSLVDGLYYADSLAQLLKTEFRGFAWWDLRNGTDTNGSFDALIYGWRTYGDLGMINGVSTRHPTFYAAKLMQSFARPGDKILPATCDHPLVSAYAARRASGAISLLVLNKSLVTNFDAQISIAGFVPTSVATVRSFGVANDDATRTNGPAGARDISTNSFSGAGASFSYNSPTLSMTLFTLVPANPILAALPPVAPGEFAFQLQGQRDVRYVIQSSSNLLTWLPEMTNTLSSGSVVVTNPTPSGLTQKYWRAVWQP